MEEARQIQEENNHPYLKLTLIIIAVVVIIIAVLIGYYVFKSQAEDFADKQGVDAIKLAENCGDGMCDSKEAGVSRKE